jgi:hypothetical protein
MDCLAKGDGCTKQQQRHAAVAVMTGIFMLYLLAAASAFARDSMHSVNVTVTARVLECASLNLIFQVPELIVTSADILRGVVVVSAATRIQVKTNNPAGYLLAFEVIGASQLIFASATVLANGREVQLSSGGGWIPQPYRRGGEALDLSYRFVLAKNARPGAYAWPFSLSVLPFSK